uniref:Phospholipase/carboxylesterase/thioesterase domain-containing protein n=1 Tax=Rhodosorus marinus TaxID=101924 RepID=A0A7S3A6S4_9RHOD|mmetsp:Transcript_5556/g.23594  ORF Transcript_5556/g.23594 Transcript_5556/m.23594 type:complete len:358 (+) Transcript_5556:630-1703(+)
MTSRGEPEIGLSDGSLGSDGLFEDADDELDEDFLPLSTNQPWLQQYFEAGGNPAPQEGGRETLNSEHGARGFSFKSFLGRETGSQTFMEEGAAISRGSVSRATNSAYDIVGNNVQVTFKDINHGAEPPEDDVQAFPVRNSDDSKPCTPRSRPERFGSKKAENEVGFPLEHDLRKGFCGGAEGVIMTPKGEHSATVIFLHEIGEHADYWVEPFARHGQLNVKYVLPCAPRRKVNGLIRDSQKRAWCGTRANSSENSEDKVGILCSVARVSAIIDEEVRKGIPASRIVIGGFGQGGAVAVNAALRFENRLGGCICLCSWLALCSDLPGCMSLASPATPIVMLQVRITIHLYTPDHNSNV